MGISARAQSTALGTVVSVSGEVDGGSAAVFEELLLRATRAHRRPLLLDLSGIDVMDCAGLAALITIRNLAAARDCALRVIAASSAVRTLAGATGAPHILDEIRGPAAPEMTF